MSLASQRRGLTASIKDERHLHDSTVRGKNPNAASTSNSLKLHLNPGITLQLFTPNDSGFVHIVGRLFSRQTTPGQVYRQEQRHADHSSLLRQKMPSLGVTCHDDKQTHNESSLTNGKKSGSGKWNVLHWPIIDRLFSRDQTDPAKQDEEDAKLLDNLIEKGVELDFSVYNAKGQGVVYFCLASNSINVFSSILKASKADGFPNEKRPDLHLRDVEHRMPLTYALKERRFHFVKLMVAAGVLEGMLKQQQTKITHISSQTQSTRVRREPSSCLELFMTSLRDPLKRQEQRMEEFDNKLRIHEAMDDDLKVKVMQNNDEIHANLFSAVDQLTSSGSLDESTALMIFTENQFNLASAMTVVENMPRIARRTRSEGTQTCIVCFEEIIPGRNHTVDLPCGHLTCDKCWKGVLDSRLDEGDVQATVCPSPDCNYHFPLRRVSTMLPQGSTERFARLYSSRYVEINPNLKNCPKQNCGNVLSIGSGSDDGTVESKTPFSVNCTCGHSFCWKCMNHDHEPATCEQVEEWRRALGLIQSESKSRAWVKAETVPCPRCRTPIERNGGCNHMSCTFCRQQFCYQCGRKWKGHSDHYTCLSTRVAANEKVHVASRFRTIMETVFEKMSQRAQLTCYEWHLSQYYSHLTNDDEIRAVAQYMTELLTATLPSKRQKEFLTPPIDAPISVDYIQRWAEELLTTKRVMRNAYILSFNLRKGSSRKKFLAKRLEQLETLMEMLSDYFYSIPGCEKISSRVVIENNRRCIPFSEEVAELEQQFLYCHAVHNNSQRIDQVCDKVRKMRCEIIRSSRIGLLHHKKPFQQKIPSATSTVIPPSSVLSSR